MIGSTNTTYIVKSTLLKKHIDRFYIFKNTDPVFLKTPTILPGTGLELLFNISEPLSFNKKRLPLIHTICPRKIIAFDTAKELHFLSVRFKSGAFRHFQPLEFSVLIDDYLSFGALWDKKSADIFSKEATPETNIASIEYFLTECFENHHNPYDDKWDEIIDYLYYNFHQTSIKEVSEKYNLSVRQFERNFKIQFGITPKKFQSLARIQTVIKRNLIAKKKSYNDIIYDFGYFDQSHFIREFKSITNQTPLKYFNEENFNNNFYHKSINNDLTE